MIDEHAHWKAPPGVAVFEPEWLSTRMSTQQGVFLWPGDISLTMMENLLAVPRIERALRKLTLPVSEWAKGRINAHGRWLCFRACTL